MGISGGPCSPVDAPADADPHPCGRERTRGHQDTPDRSVGVRVVPADGGGDERDHEGRDDIDGNDRVRANANSHGIHRVRALHADRANHEVADAQSDGYNDDAADRDIYTHDNGDDDSNVDAHDRADDDADRHAVTDRGSVSALRRSVQQCVFWSTFGDAIR